MAACCLPPDAPDLGTVVVGVNVEGVDGVEGVGVEGDLNKQT